MFISCDIRFTCAIPAPYVNGLELAAAQELLDAKLLCYDEHLKGILLSYCNLVGGGEGRFQDEQSDVLYTFSTTVTLYSPQVESLFQATVSEISAGSVLLLAAGVFPISVPVAGFPLNSIYSKTSKVRTLVDAANPKRIMVEIGGVYLVKCVNVIASPNSDIMTVEATFQT
jgi:hypothetical protein